MTVPLTIEASSRELTQEEEVILIFEQIPKIADSATRTVEDGTETFIFFAGFDGTNNDRDDLKESETTQPTNIYELVKQVEYAPSYDTNQKVVVGYYPGHGTDGTGFGSEALPWLVTNEAERAAQQAFYDFRIQAAKWLIKYPDGDVTAMVTSFSRGGAAAAIFSQLLFSEGLVDPEDETTVLIPPGKVGVTGGIIFDPVLTGVTRNMNFAPNVENITVIRALDELRYFFPQAIYDDENLDVDYVDVYGNHGDIGGFYDNGIGSLTLKGATDFFIRTGLNIGSVGIVDLDPERTGENYPDRNYDSDQPLLIHDESVYTDGSVIWDVEGIAVLIRLVLNQQILALILTGGFSSSHSLYLMERRLSLTLMELSILAILSSLKVPARCYRMPLPSTGLR